MGRRSRSDSCRPIYWSYLFDYKEIREKVSDVLFYSLPVDVSSLQEGKYFTVHLTAFEMMTPTAWYRKEETLDSRVHMSKAFTLPILSMFLFFPWKRQLPVSVRLTTVPRPAEVSIKTFFPSWVSCCDAASHAKMFPHCPMMDLLLPSVGDLCFFGVSL